MFGSIRCYFVHMVPADELVRRVEEDFVARIAAQPGFLSYEFLDSGGAEVVSISVFREATQAQASRELARRWTENLKDLELTVTEALHGTILVNRIGPEIRRRREGTADWDYASLRRYRLRSGEVAELARMIDVDLADRMTKMDGFVSYRVFDCGYGDLLAVSVCRNESTAAASGELALNFVREEFGAFEIERAEMVSGGEIVVSNRTDDLLELAPS